MIIPVVNGRDVEDQSEGPGEAARRPTRASEVVDKAKARVEAPNAGNRERA